jgi:hypothetical protein
MAKREEVIYRGHGNENPAGGRLVTIETPEGETLGVLRHVVKHSPTGYTWGYGGSGPADLALSLLVDAVGDESRCPVCKGTQRVIFVDSAAEPVAYDPDDPRHVRIAEDSEGPLVCWDCENGRRPLPYQAFKREFVAVFPSTWTTARPGRPDRVKGVHGHCSDVVPRARRLHLRARRVRRPPRRCLAVRPLPAPRRAEQPRNPRARP